MPTQSDWSEVTRQWKAPSEISGAAPREVQLSAGGKGLAFLATLLFLGALAMTYFLARKAADEAANRAALDASSVQTQALVTRHWRTDDKSNTPKIAYEFEHDGRRYHGTSTTPREQWDTITVGSQIAIRYLPAQPELNHPAGWTVEVLPAWLPYLNGGMLALVGVLLIYMIRRESRLLSDGRAAPARVTGHRRIKQGYAILYEFPLPGGGVRKGRGGQTRTPPEVGSIMSVVYDPENPKRNAPYPMRLVRVVR